MTREKEPLPMKSNQERIKLDRTKLLGFKLDPMTSSATADGKSTAKLGAKCGSKLGSKAGTKPTMPTV